jgi:hypothetical protein
MKTNSDGFFVKYHIAELICGILAVIVSFISYDFGWKAFWITTASATLLGVLVATLLDKMWRNQNREKENKQ